jgi:hypothetical protein
VIILAIGAAVHRLIQKKMSKQLNRLPVAAKIPGARSRSMPTKWRDAISAGKIGFIV